MSSRRFQIVFCSSEVSPWSKTGGLGEVHEGLPVSLAQLGNRVMVITPRWDQYVDAWDTSVTVELNLGDNTECVRFFHAFKNGVDYVFVDHPIFLETVWGLSEMKFYGPTAGTDWPNNQYRFALFSKSVLEALQKLSLGGYCYGEECAIVCSDWHTSLIPIYINQERKTLSKWLKTRVCMLIHNIVFQGRFLCEQWQQHVFGFTDEFMSTLKIHQSLKVGGKGPIIPIINFLKGGILNADKLLTVSKTFAKEVTSDSARGAELNTFIQEKNGIYGIRNGIKDNIDPMNVEFCNKIELPMQYSYESFREAKKMAKLQFQSSLNLEVNPNIPMFLFIGRFDYQKGCDLYIAAIDQLLSGQSSFFSKGNANSHLQSDASVASTRASSRTQSFIMSDRDQSFSRFDIQFVMFGSGANRLTALSDELKAKYPKHFVSAPFSKSNEKYLAYAASDFVVLPCRFEPCGLVQMEGMRFGCIPICAPTGGFIETVNHMETGIFMSKPLCLETMVVEESVTSITDSLKLANKIFHEKPEMLDSLALNGIYKTKDFSWKNSALEYEKFFESINVSDISEFMSKTQALTTLTS